MVWVKVCRDSLSHFSSCSDGQPTDKILNVKDFKETSPPSQSHAFVEIYLCQNCFDGVCTNINEINHKDCDAIRTEFGKGGVATSPIYTNANMASEDQVLQTFESSRTEDEIKNFLRSTAVDADKYNVYTNNCLCFVLDVCHFLGNPLPDEELQRLKLFMEKLSSTEGWLRLASRWILWIGVPLISCYGISYFYTG